ncbi:MAG: hypothetical protein AB1746_02190 [Candidatus Zixiibacteriota bacterium]
MSNKYQYMLDSISELELDREEFYKELLNMSSFLKNHELPIDERNKYAIIILNLYKLVFYNLRESNDPAIDIYKSFYHDTEYISRLSSISIKYFNIECFDTLCEYKEELNDIIQDVLSVDYGYDTKYDIEACARSQDIHGDLHFDSGLVINKSIRVEALSRELDNNLIFVKKHEK